MSKAMAFKPEEHFRNLKGQNYLEVKWRVVWFREEHEDGYIATDLIEHDAVSGLAVFKARVGRFDENGKDIYANGYGSETRKDFADYLEKAETKAIGRALAMLGYGTAQASELDEGERLADTPVTAQEPAHRTARPSAPPVASPSTRPAVTPAADPLRQELTELLALFPDAAAKLKGRTLSDKAVADGVAKLRLRAEAEPARWVGAVSKLLEEYAVAIPTQNSEILACKTELSAGNRLGLLTTRIEGETPSEMMASLGAMYDVAVQRWPALFDEQTVEEVTGV